MHHNESQVNEKAGCRDAKRLPGSCTCGCEAIIIQS